MFHVIIWRQGPWRACALSTILLALLLLAAGRAQAAAYAWSNAAGGTWNTTTNWSPAGDPSSTADTAALGDLSGPYTATLGVNRTIGGLTLTGSDPTLSVSAGATLLQSGGTGTISGGTLTGAGTVQWKDGAAITWSSATAPGGTLTVNIPVATSMPTLANATGGWALTSGQTLSITGEWTASQSSPRVFAVSNGFTNAGAIVLGNYSTTAWGVPAATITLKVTDGTFTNAATGQVTLYPRTTSSSPTHYEWSQKILDLELHNDGLITSYSVGRMGNAVGTTVGRAGANHVNDGTLRVDDSMIGYFTPASLRITGDTFTNNGVLNLLGSNANLVVATPTFTMASTGTVTGSGRLCLGVDNTVQTVNWNAATDPTDPVTYRIVAGARVTLNRATPWTLQAGQTLHLDTPHGLNTMGLTLNQDLINNGTIRMGNPQPGDHNADQYLTVSSPLGRLTNNSGGVITMYARNTTDLQLKWSYRLIDAELVNHGQFNVLTWNGALGAAGDNHLNDGTLTLDSTYVPPSKKATLAVTGASFTNAAGGTIGGNGVLTVTGVTTGLTNHGTLAPGLSIGTLSVTGNVTFGDTGALSAEVAQNGTSDLLAITGNLDLSAAGDALLIDGLAPATGQWYTVLTYTGTRLGEFDVLRTLTDAVNPRSVQYVGNTVQVFVIPEPTAAVLLVGGAGLGLLSRRRRYLGSGGESVGGNG